jgi:hypothetical protein
MLVSSVSPPTFTAYNNQRHCDAGGVVSQFLRRSAMSASAAWSAS